MSRTPRVAVPALPQPSPVSDAIAGKVDLLTNLISPPVPPNLLGLVSPAFHLQVGRASKTASSFGRCQVRPRAGQPAQHPARGLSRAYQKIGSLDDAPECPGVCKGR